MYPTTWPLTRDTLEIYICKTCGVQYAPSKTPPQDCIICEDERQYIGWEGQRWTTLADMRAAGYQNELRELEPGLTGIGTQPSFAIGQRALLVQTAYGNILWDCISFMDVDTVQQVEGLGGIQAMSLSHPHFYGTMVEWSHAFGNAPIYLPYADRRWITRPDPAIKHWENSLEIFPGVALIQCGGHFEGSTVLHWREGASGRGALLVGDTITVVQDRRWVSFMHSYPNLIPLPASAVRHIVETVRPYPFDRMYGGWWGREVLKEAMQALERSAERYIKQIRG